MPLLLAASEPSADALAAALVPALRARWPDLPLIGLCGPRLRAAGVVPVGRSDELGVLGLAEALPRLCTAMRARSALLRALMSVRAVVTVDGPDLLLGVAHAAKKRGLPVVHVVSPQVWAWRPGRVHTVAKSVHALACLFPFEPALYAGTGLNAVYTGHPLAVSSGPRLAEPGSLGLVPGSRTSEVVRLWPVMCEVVRRLRPTKVWVAVAPEVDPSLLTGILWERAPTVADLARRSGRVLVASGTATLEVAIHGCPQVVLAAIHPVSWAVLRHCVHTPFVALPNILAGRAVVAEHVQHLSPDAIVTDLLQAEPVHVDLVGGAVAVAAMVDLIAETVGAL